MVNLNYLNKSTAYVDKFESLFGNHINKSCNGSYLSTRSVSMVMVLRNSSSILYQILGGIPLHASHADAAIE